MTLGPLPRMTSKAINSMSVHALLDSTGPTRPPADMLKGWADDMGEEHMDWLATDYLTEDGRMLMAYQSFLIQIEGTSILVDCAVGEDGDFPVRPDWHRKKSNWLAHLGQAGLTPDDIDIVFLTHLHLDHTGWLTRREADNWTPTFPKARHLVSKTELDFWSANHEGSPAIGNSWRDSVAPVLEAGLMETLSPGDQLDGTLEVVDLAGHTPGMMGLELRDGDAPVAAFNADLMHHPLQMAHPELATIFCSDADGAIATRRAKLAAYAEAGTVMFCNHFPGESAGKAVAHGEGYKFRRCL